LIWRKISMGRRRNAWRRTTIVADVVAATAAISAAATLLDAGLNFQFDRATGVSVPGFLPGECYRGRAQNLDVERKSAAHGGHGAIAGDGRRTDVIAMAAGCSRDQIVISS
jgi:hypothetical protein